MGIVMLSVTYSIKRTKVNDTNQVSLLCDNVLDQEGSLKRLLGLEKIIRVMMTMDFVHGQENNL